MDGAMNTPDVAYLLSVAGGAIVMLLVLIMRFKVHAFVALTLVSMLTALATGVTYDQVIPTMLTGFAGLLHQRTGQSDLVIGLAAAGQSFHDQGKLVGHCVNLLPLRLQVTGADVFTDVLAGTRGALLDAYDHQGVSIGTLQENLELTRDGA